MRRYYLSPIKLYNEPGLGDFYGHHFQQTYTDVDYLGGEIAVDPVTGTPTQKAILVLVGGIDHRTYANDPELIPMPDIKPDVKVSSIDASTKVATKSRGRQLLNQSQSEVDAIWNNADGYRDVLNHYGRLNNPDFDANNFDLTDL